EAGGAHFQAPAEQGVQLRHAAGEPFPAGVFGVALAARAGEDAHAAPLDDHIVPALVVASPAQLGNLQAAAGGAVIGSPALQADNAVGRAVEHAVYFVRHVRVGEEGGGLDFFQGVAQVEDLPAEADRVFGHQ